MKKIITMFMAVALVLSATIPVSAAEPVSETEVVLKNGIERSSSKVVIKGIEGKTVKTIKLLNPDIPAMID